MSGRLVGVLITVQGGPVQITPGGEGKLVLKVTATDKAEAGGIAGKITTGDAPVKVDQP